MISKKVRLQYFKDLKFNFNTVIKKHHLDFTKVYLPYTTIYWPLSVESKDLDSTKFINELSRTDIWEPWIPNSHSLRNKYKTGTSEFLDELIQMVSLVKRKELIQQCWDSDPYVFHYHWQRGLDFYLRTGAVNCQILKDEPGFAMSPHRDNTEIIGQYIVNLTDNGTATTNFFNLNPNTLMYKSSGERKKGVGFLNTTISNHNIEGVDKTRYTLYFSVLQDFCAPDKIDYELEY